ncbi:hypothetical protein D3C80_857630 [compost metagenome]
MLNEDHRHAATNVTAGRTTHQLATMTIQTDVHLWATLLVEAGLGIGHLITGDDQATLNGRRTTTFTELEGFGGRFRSTRLGTQTELQVGRFTEDTLGFGSVLHAWQLDHDAVGALALYQRLGNAQLVDAVTYRGQVLLDRVFTDFRDLGRGNRQTQHRQAITLGGGQLEIVEILADQAASLFAGVFIGEAQLNAAILLRQAAIAHALFAQQAFDFAFIDFQTGLHGLVHVHFEEEVHTTGQVQTQFHRACAQVTQPLRSRRGQVKCDYVVIAQCLAHNILGWQLIFLLGQTHQRAFALLAQACSLDLDSGFDERFAHAIQIRLSDLQRRAGTADLDGRIIRVEVGSGINKTDRQYHQDQCVFPQRVFVQHHAARSRRGARCAPRLERKTGNSDSLERTFWQGGRDGTLLELQLDVVGNFQYHEIIGNLDDLAGDAAVGDNFVTFLQVAQQVLLLFGALGLWTPDHQVEDDQETDQENPLEASTGWAGGWGSCVRVCGRDQKAHLALQLQISTC